MRGIVLRGLAASIAATLLIGCGGSAATPAPTAFSPVGTWSCARASNPTGPDAVVINADGTINITQPGGQSGSGTWTMDGSTFTVHGIGRGGEEDFNVSGDHLVSSAGDVDCTRAS